MENGDTQGSSKCCISSKIQKMDNRWLVGVIAVLLLVNIAFLFSCPGYRFIKGDGYSFFWVSESKGEMNYCTYTNARDIKKSLKCERILENIKEIDNYIEKAQPKRVMP